MHATEPHRDAGAYALGVLGAADTCRFEEHLTECAACVVQVREFGSVVDCLAEFARCGEPAAARRRWWPGRYLSRRDSRRSARGLPPV
ncbi:zf-HC2 domain-containing protein [Streptomyces sp. NPDC056749]|uniref:zf-HC2 domain-containing protein n=1 Tax=Streptomyces sp. NPDC056749 TaxID=3345936 RepID=UPI0036AB9BD7